ncbi:hypothetical protein LPJ61_005213 [Coemansia biformis]|uniref:Uncharacterized protein n=1 Tax=Coemansia biformis TaxID=1286918 RepID=A0A9W8CWU9_9FUNG|nr:hypothetical protein LPJ61_005213 [Coemansia biformis]
MLLFSIGSDTAGGNSAESGSVDDSKPNSLYGGSVRQQRQMNEGGLAIALQDLSPRNAAVFTGDDESVVESGVDLSSPVFSMLDMGPDSGYDEDPYELDPPNPMASTLLLAECCVERAASRRRENYYYTTGKKAGWWV